MTRPGPRGRLRQRTRARTPALAGPALAQEEPGGEGRGRRHRVPPDQISIQLFTLRDQLAIDLEGTLQALHQIGYTRVENAGFVGRTVQEFKAALDAAGLRASSGHVPIPQPFDPVAWSASLADAKTLGSRYIVHPFFGINFTTGEVVRTTAPWRAFARDLNRAGRMARDAGPKLGYHNHNWEFFRLTDNPSRTAYDALTDATDPELVHLEMNLFWVTRGARDPVDLIRQHKGRVLQFHVKDMNREGSFEDPGQGLLDFARIFRHSKEAGVKETSSSVTTPAHRLGSPRTPWTPPGSATSSSGRSVSSPDRVVILAKAQ